MSQSTLLQFFSRTPKANKTDGAENGKGGETPTSVNGKQSTSNGNSKVTTPKSVTKTPLRVVASPSTPVSRTGTGGTKRRRDDAVDNSSQAEQSRKKIRNGDDGSPSKEYSAGSLVWAKLEGYPWWPAMVRGETRKGRYFKMQSMEFHVQFFDNPPTRAWIRKGDIKPYNGSTDADIPPAKSDRSWVEAVKSADNALSMKKSERLDEYWHEFEMDGAEDKSEEEEIENVDDEPELQETPKSRRMKDAKKHKRIRAISSSSDEENGTNSNSRKSKRDDNESDSDNYSPTKSASAEEESESEESPEEINESEEEIGSSDEEDDHDAGRNRKGSKSKAKRDKNTRAPTTPKAGCSNRKDIKSKFQQFDISQSPSCKPKSHETADSGPIDTNQNQTTWTHLTWSWAKEGNRMDAHKRKETHPNYDPRTLFVEDKFLKTLSPGVRQWWEIKMRNFDTVIFFKVGKFYEFYHWDACIAAEELGITYMKGDFAHSGFPEVSFSRFANTLVEKGYKIARVEQTETPEMMNERVKHSKRKLEKHEKIITREICQISTKGVRYASFQDEVFSSPFSPESVYLYGIVEMVSSAPNEPTVFGVCFVDTTIGIFHIGQFADDRHASRLRTLFSHHVPAQILHEKNKISPGLQQLFHNMSNVRKDPLLSDSEFWTAKKTLKYLAEQEFLRDNESCNPSWPPALQAMLCKNDGLGLTPDDNWELGIKSLGGVIWYLKHCLLDHDLLSQKRFQIYMPVDANVEEKALPQRCTGPKFMILDGITIRNLDILNGPTSLLSTVDKCSTNFGKRLLRSWICLPLAVPDEISERQDAIEQLMEQRECRENVIPDLKSLPDLERLLSKIHYLGSSHRSKNHPDGRAHFFEEVKYSKNKISDLLSTLKGFKTCVKIVRNFRDFEDKLNCKLLNQLLEAFPDLDDLLTNFDNSFDHQMAVREGQIKPRPGALDAYDSAVQAVQDIETKADEYLRTLSRTLGTRAVYFGSDKKRFQIEVPERLNVPPEFEMTGKKKGYKRYWSGETKKFLNSIMKAESEREEVLRDVARQIFEKFDKHREIWSTAVDCIAKLDVLISLSIFSESQENMCRPLVSYSMGRENAFINIEKGHHPCYEHFTPNDTKLGVPDEQELLGNFVILTGPNMGGKSTLMRQVGLLAVLSHLGCYVPAEKCEMSVVDRVFTRLGANDNIGEGESTFFVEMSETSAILKHSSPDSLLLIDELGRGTATYDGTAIAYAVAKDLSAKNCRSLFSTHYHTLVDALQDNSRIQMCHMSCMVENENEDDPTLESITFLYEMTSGPCPKSYGFNAARLAGISDDVIRLGHKKAKELESSVAEIRMFTDICSNIRNEKFSLKDFAALEI